LRLKEVGGFAPKGFSVDGCFFHYEFFCGAENRQFLLGAVSSCAGFIMIGQLALYYFQQVFVLCMPLILQMTYSEFQNLFYL
jgi:hypothetical protein